MARNLACQWGKNSWSVEMRGMPVRWNSARHIVAIILQCSKTFPHCHNLSRRHCCATSWKFVNYEQTRHNYWVTRRAKLPMRVVTWHFEMFTTAWHASLRTRTYTVKSLLPGQIACHGVNRLSCKCHWVHMNHLDFVPLKWHDLARPLQGIAGTTFAPVSGLL